MTSPLLATCEKVLRQTQRGAPRTQVNYRQGLRQIVADLTVLKQLPATWSKLSEAQVQALVRYWQQRAISAESIANRLSILRGFYQRAGLSHAIPSNQQLGVQTIGFVSPTFDIQQLEQLHHPLVKTTVAFECYFGVTRQESYQLMLTSATVGSSLLIHSDIAQHRRGRFIPITTEIQQQAIKSRYAVLQDKARLVDCVPSASLSALCRAELAVLGLTGAAFRVLYARDRFKQLSAQHPNAIVWAHLQEEMGIASLSRLKRWIHGETCA